MRVLVTGGRSFDDADMLDAALDDLNAEFGISCVIHGLAQGADTLAGYWAHKRKIEVFAIRADWKRYGKDAGPIRNGDLLKKGRPDLVLAFPGGKGTRNMMQQADKAGVPIKNYPVLKSLNGY
jgi:hypothetical protein